MISTLQGARLYHDGQLDGLRTRIPVFLDRGPDEPIDGVAPPDGLTRFTADGPGNGTLWIVIRDGRGGETWLTFPWVAQ